MTRSIGAAVVVLAFIFGDLIPIVSVAAAPLQATVRGPSSAVTEPGARRRIRHYPRYAYRTFAQPDYLDRPRDYAPAPFVPFNFGYPIGPWQ
jgi:hypothetical protein